MFKVFGSVKGLLKLDDVSIDNNTFRLHYKVTVILLVGFFLIVTSTQYIGDPIECTTEDKIPQKLMDTYCRTHSTFTILSKLNATVGEDAAGPGVAPHQEGEELQFHEYYQSVCFVLFFQAICFFAPRFLWKSSWEGGRMKTLVLNLDCPLVSEECKNERKKLLVDYFVNHLHKHNFYALRFFTCEVLNFINVIAQIYFTDHFLGGGFLHYGYDVLTHTQKNYDVQDSPMNRVFPKMTHCIYRPYDAPTGAIKVYHETCILPLNVVNEKMYLLLWFWFIILATVTGAELIFRVAVMCSAQLRLYLLRAQSRLSPRDHITTLANSCQFGDWFVLYQLGKNMDSFIYTDLIADLSKRLWSGKSCENKVV